MGLSLVPRRTSPAELRPYGRVDLCPRGTWLAAILRLSGVPSSGTNVRTSKFGACGATRETLPDQAIVQVLDPVPAATLRSEFCGTFTSNDRNVL